ncbi:MAG: YicC family protein [Ignavibacteriales bacterium]|nr:YicC family protein [Ignavibacteriales bacterium]
MISSMTGFGRGIVKHNDLIIDAEIKSLNNRFLDLIVKLPPEFNGLEYTIRKIVSENITRGKVVLNINIKNNEFNHGYLTFNPNQLKQVIKLVNNIKKISNDKSTIDLNTLLNFKELFISTSIPNPQDNYDLILKAVLSAVDNLKKMRLKEGKELKADFILRIKKIQNYVTEIEKKTRSSINEYFEKIKVRSIKLLEQLKHNEDLLKMELAILTERHDITEECVRLKSHLKMFLSTLNSPDEIGRKLDFISQEMNREINTINSKTVSAEITKNGILIKEELEKIREQIQNIE